MTNSDDKISDTQENNKKYNGCNEINKQFIYVNDRYCTKIVSRMDNSSNLPYNAKVSSNTHIIEEKSKENINIKQKPKRYKRRYVTATDSSNSDSENENEDSNNLENENERYYYVKVENLNKECKEKELYDLFGIVGNLKSVEIKNDSPNRYALIKYSSEVSAQKALYKFKYIAIKGSNIKLSVYYHPNELIIENLAPTADIEKIKNIVSVVGEAKSIIIERGKNNNETGRAIITFKEKEGKENALVFLNDVVIDDIQIKLVTHDNNDYDNDISSPTPPHPQPPPPPLISPSKPFPPILSTTVPTPQPPQSNDEYKLFDKTDILIIKNLTKKEIAELFRDYKIKKIKSKSDDNVYEVYFENDDLADKAYIELNHRKLNDKEILIEKHIRKSQLYSVFVGCLSDSVKEEDLYQKFEDIGEVDSVKIYRQKNKNVPDYGYVNFKDTECVDKAVKVLNGINIKGRYITVQYTKKKIHQTN